MPQRPTSNPDPSSPLSFFEDWIEGGGLRLWLAQMIPADPDEEPGLRYDAKSDVVSGVTQSLSAPSGWEDVHFMVADRLRGILDEQTRKARSAIQSVLLQNPGADDVGFITSELLRTIGRLRQVVETDLLDSRRRDIRLSLDELELVIRTSGNRQGLNQRTPSHRNKPARKKWGRPDLVRTQSRAQEIELVVSYVRLLPEHRPARSGIVTDSMKWALKKLHPEFGSVDTIRRRLLFLAKELDSGELAQVASRAATSGNFVLAAMQDLGR